MDPLVYLRFAGALAIVLGLLAGFAWLLRRYGHKISAFGLPSPHHKGRLGVVEQINIDPRRRLVLIKRDDVEHLLLLSTDTAQVIETGIPSKTTTPETQP
jgi:flagellar protein FliO/FliZ